MIRRRAPRAALLASAACAIAAGDAQATAFQLREGSAAAQGASLAGRTANDRDVSFALANPAALRGVEGGEVSGGLSGILILTEARASGTGGLGPGFDTEDEPGGAAAIPSFAAGWRWSDEIVIGLTVQAPFGLSTEYDRDFVGAFDGVESALETIAVTPLLAFEPADGLAIAGGPVIQYAHAKLTSLRAPGELIELEGDDIALGFKLGALLDIGSRTTAGLAFSYGIEHTLEGEFTNYPPPFAGDGEAELPLPAVASVGVVHALRDDIRVMAEVEWTGWNAYDQITITDPDAPVPIVREENYDNSFMAAVGGEYDWSDGLTLRAGVAYDRSPTVDATRNVSVPDSDRYWLSAGASYEVTERIGLDAAYTLLLAEDAEVRLKRTPAPTTVSYESTIHLLSVNARYRW